MCQRTPSVASIPIVSNMFNRKTKDRPKFCSSPRRVFTGPTTLAVRHLQLRCRARARPPCRSCATRQSLVEHADSDWDAAATAVAIDYTEHVADSQSGESCEGPTRTSARSLSNSDLAALPRDVRKGSA